MIKFTKSLIVPAVAAMTLVGFVGSETAAFAQMAGDAPLKTHVGKRYHTTAAQRPLTVRRRMAARPAGSEVTAKTALKGPHPGSVTAATGPVGGVVAPVTGVASTIVGAPFQVLGNIFPAPGPRKGGPTSVRYAGTGAKESEIDEGFAQAVPVDKSGPIFVVENGDPTISPLSVIGAPIAVAGTLAQTPFRILGATGL